MTVSTYGLTHIALGVADPARSFDFYRDVFGMVAVYRQPDFIQAQTPGSRDVLVFEKSQRTGESGGIAHFGFRLTDPADIGRAEAAVRNAGGTVVERGEFVPGEPYLYARDLDGYMIEIWYEVPTKVDPAFAEAINDEIMQIRGHVWRGVMRELSYVPVGRHASDVKAPVLVLSGGKDVLFPAEHHQSLLKALPHAEGRVFAELGHNPNWEQPEAVASAIDLFLKSNR